LILFFSFNLGTGGLIVALICYATLFFVLVTWNYLFFALATCLAAISFPQVNCLLSTFFVSIF